MSGIFGDFETPHVHKPARPKKLVLDVTHFSHKVNDDAVHLLAEVRATYSDDPVLSDLEIHMFLRGKCRQSRKTDAFGLALFEDQIRFSELSDRSRENWAMGFLLDDVKSEDVVHFRVVGTAIEAAAALTVIYRKRTYL